MSVLTMYRKITFVTFLKKLEIRDLINPPVFEYLNRAIAIHKHIKCKMSSEKFVRIKILCS